MGGGFEAWQEQISLQAHYVKPVFNLLEDIPQLAKHLFEALTSYGIRLADMKVDSSSENLGEGGFQVTFQHLATARVFLDRVEITSAYLPFLRDFRDGAFVADLLGSIQEYSPDVSWRAFAVTQEIHGKLLDTPLEGFLLRFSAAAPETLGQPLGSGTVFYFGAAENRLTGSLALDFSRIVEGGLFLKMAILFDAAQIELRDLLVGFHTQLLGLIEEIGLEFRRRNA